MVTSIWTSQGAEKAKSSQSIRILLRSLQYLAQDFPNSKNYINVVSSIFQDLFKPDKTISINTQVHNFLDAIGWKNVEISAKSNNSARILLGNNRFLEQNQSEENGLITFVKAITTGIGFYLLETNVISSVSIDLTSGAQYTVELKAKTRSSQRVTSRQSLVPESPVIELPKEYESEIDSGSESKVEEQLIAIESDQLIFPIINGKLPLTEVLFLLQDVMVEFAKSWYQFNPLDTRKEDDIRNKLTILLQFLVDKSVEGRRKPKAVGNQIGRFFAQATVDKYSKKFGVILSDEILESQTSVLIRDIKARSLCYLNPGDKCVQENRAICDFAMGIYEGVLSHITKKEYEFSNYFAAGKKDTYCLMEFQSN